MNRRTFLHRIGLFSIFHVISSCPLFLVVKSISARAKRIILPPGTKRQTLINKDPAILDPRNLAITPLKDFGVMGLSDYRIMPKSWRLRVEGHVKNPLTLSYDEILSFPVLERKVLLICPGVFANYGKWKGVSIKRLIENAGVKTNATHITISGPESAYKKTERFPLSEVLQDKVFLAYAVNDKILPQKHGYPLRLVADGHYGFKWVKYVDRIRVEVISGI